MFSSREIGLAAKDSSWEFGLSNELPLDLVFEVGAVDAHLDLTALLVKNLSLQTGASSTNLKLPAVGWNDLSKS